MFIRREAVRLTKSGQNKGAQRRVSGATDTEPPRGNTCE